MRRIHGLGPELGCDLVVIELEATTPVVGVPEPVEVAALALRWTGGYWYETARYTSVIRPPESTPSPAVETRTPVITADTPVDARLAAAVLGELDRSPPLADCRLVTHGAGSKALVLRDQRTHYPRLAATPLRDTVALARAVLGPRPSYRLDTVLEHYQLPVPPVRHGAGDEVALTAQVFLGLLVGGQRGGRRSDLPSLERAAGRAPAHQIEPREHREAPAA